MGKKWKRMLVHRRAAANSGVISDTPAAEVVVPAEKTETVVEAVEEKVIEEASIEAVKKPLPTSRKKRAKKTKKSD